MLQTFCEHPKGKGLSAAHRLLARLPVSQYSWEVDNLGDPTAIVFALDFDYIHVRYYNAGRPGQRDKCAGGKISRHLTQEPLMSLIADAPWWISLIIVILGIAIFFAGNGRQSSGMRNGGLGIALLGILVFALGFVLDSPTKGVERSTRQFVEAVSTANWTEVEPLLDPTVSWEWSGQPWHVSGAPAVLAGAKMVVKNSGMHSANVKSPKVADAGNGTYTNDCICWITSESTGGYPVDSDWQFTWHQAADSKWKLTHLKVTRVGDAAPSGIKSSLDKH